MSRFLPNVAAQDPRYPYFDAHTYPVVLLLPRALRVIAVADGILGIELEMKRSAVVE